MLSQYQQARAVRRENRTLAGKFKGGKLAPIMAVPFRESESGSVSQTVTYELDPIAGRMITPIQAEIISIFVPAPAADALKNPLDDFPGNAEAFRQKLLSGTPVFDVEPEGELSKRMGIVPRSVAGVKNVNEIVRLSHNVAVNYLRKSKYVKAAQLLAESTAMTPALISQTVLDRMNGVLDPEDRVNGAVNLAGTLNVNGIGAAATNTFGTANKVVNESGGTQDTYAQSSIIAGTSTSYYSYLKEDPNNPGYPLITADLADAQGLTIQDFYLAERTDQLTRVMRKMVDDHPQYGEELVSRFAHGLSVDTGKEPFVVYRQTRTFGMSMQRATDGANLDVTQSNMAVQHDFTVPIPATEFGGILITFAAVKPDETIATQPHPILSQEWGARNHVADELAVDPVPVTIRELDGDCLQVDETTVAFYVGNNHLEKTYINYGFNRHLNPTDVANKTALWQLEVPMSVTPDSVLYPEDLNHYPFADQLAEVCTYTINSAARINTPRIFGPTPVEELAAIETADIFQDAPA